MFPLGVIVVLLVAKWVGAEAWKWTDGGNIVVGAGYSSDKQQIVPQRCYNASVSSISAQEGFAQLDTAQSFSGLEDVLGISLSIGGSYNTFSAEAIVSYLKSIQDKDYSMSLNYYQYATNRVAVQLLGHGEGALNEDFRAYYDGGKNPYFGLFCGDYYIGSYRQGALLTMGLNIKFSSSEAKTEFVGKIGVSFGDIISAALSVQNVVLQYGIKGSITIHAFQMGGKPNELANILSNDSSGEYYSMACSLAEMYKCIKAAGGLLDYAKHEFSKQFSTENSTGLTPLGTAFTDFIPIKYANLTPPASLVTPKVEQCRKQLFGKLKENEYYQQKLYPLLNNGYPVQLDTDFLRNASYLLSKANRNAAILMQAHGGAADCFNFPDKCVSVKAGIDSLLQDITADDLQFLEAVKYTLHTRGGTLYNTARHSFDDTDLTKWEAVPDDKLGKESIVKVLGLIVTEGAYAYATVVQAPGTPLYYYFYEGNRTVSSVDGTATYLGILLSRQENGGWLPVKEGYPEYKLISPFFFDVYNNTRQSQHHHQTNKKLQF